MTSDVLFYSKIVPLNRDQHRAYRLDLRPDRFGFAARSNMVPALVDEFVAASTHLPIVFTPGTPEFVPLFLTGLRTGVSALVAKDGSWSGDYIPAYLRRYPFIVGEVAGGQPLACIDEAAGRLTDGDGPSMFDEAGAETPALIERIQFANDYYGAAQRNSAFVKLLTELGLFRTVSIDAKFDSGESISIQGFLTVDADKLNTLPDEDFLRLRSAGYLAPIYAHLASLNCVDRIRRAS